MQQQKGRHAQGAGQMGHRRVDGDQKVELVENGRRLREIVQGGCQIGDEAVIKGMESLFGNK